MNFDWDEWDAMFWQCGSIDIPMDFIEESAGPFFGDFSL
jgi:hypothetical protein